MLKCQPWSRDRLSWRVSCNAALGVWMWTLWMDLTCERFSETVTPRMYMYMGHGVYACCATKSHSGRPAYAGGSWRATSVVRYAREGVRPVRDVIWKPLGASRRS